jgi:hypothetical protein
MHEISKAIYDRGNSGSVEKFDYFVCSVAGALFAYVGQKLKQELEKKARSKFKWANYHERFRDICLLLGFALILASKVFQAYIKP